jgi:hypothetical protein
MGDYRHRAIIVHGSNESVDKMYEALLDVIAEAGLHPALAVQMTLGTQPPVRGNNGFSFFMIAPSGGKAGGADMPWERVREAWKQRLVDDQIGGDWVQVLIDELNGESIEQTKYEHRQSYLEQNDPC